MTSRWAVGSCGSVLGEDLRRKVTRSQFGFSRRNRSWSPTPGATAEYVSDEPRARAEPNRLLPRITGQPPSFRAPPAVGLCAAKRAASHPLTSVGSARPYSGEREDAPFLRLRPVVPAAWRPSMFLPGRFGPCLAGPIPQTGMTGIRRKPATEMARAARGRARPSWPRRRLSGNERFLHNTAGCSEIGWSVHRHA